MRFDMYFSKDYRVNWGALGESWLFGSGDCVFLNSIAP